MNGDSSPATEERHVSFIFCIPRIVPPNSLFMQRIAENGFAVLL